MDALEALPIMQAIYNVVKDEVATGKLGNTRNHAEQTLRDMFEQTGGQVDSIKLQVNGETVGALNATKKEGVTVTDQNLLGEWLQENGYIVSKTAFVMTDLDEDELTELQEWAQQRWPEHVREIQQVDESWQDHIGHVGSTVIDSNGEVVPGVEWRTTIGQVRISGCGWAADPKKRTSKYAPVGDALARAGLGFGQVMGLLEGDAQ